MKEIIPLADILCGHADRFHFNGLSMVGEGADLILPEKEEYLAFIDSYEKAFRQNPVLGLKDNMLGILSYKNGRQPFGGCTTFGCVAAFNFLAVLSATSVHACRKFPSHLGNIFKQSISEIYDSPQAQRYRAGCAESHSPCLWGMSCPCLQPRA